MSACREGVWGVSGVAPGQPVHRGGQLEIEPRESSGVVRRELHRDPVPGVRPVRVVVHLLGGESGAGHEAEGLGEVGEPEFAPELAGGEQPAGEGREARVDLGVGEAGGRFMRTILAPSD